MRGSGGVIGSAFVFIDSPGLVVLFNRNCIHQFPQKYRYLVRAAGLRSCWRIIILFWLGDLGGLILNVRNYLQLPTMRRNLILITGVTRGLGRAMVEEFVLRDCCVVGCGRSQKEIGELKKLWEEPHDFQVVDVSRDE